MTDRTSRYFREQQRRNASRRDAWRRFAAHREQITRLLRAGPTGRLCVLGAGNCDDLDLAELAQRFKFIELIDLDDAAMRAGADRQGFTASEQLCLNGDCDLTGMLDQIERTDGQISAEEWIQMASRVPSVSVNCFEVVASVCTLSQLIETAAGALGADCPSLPQAVLAVRRQHLQLMLSLMDRGGIGWLITDFVSSDTCPELLDVPASQLAAAAAHWIAARNFFTGANPLAISQSLRHEMSPSVVPESVVVRKPWKWVMGPRCYAVSAIGFRKQ